MVKLFVGGLPEGVDSIRLRQLFSQFVIVNECDVIKDYAFVHVATDEHARTAIEKLDGYILEGKSINIRWSTSKLRKEPGVDKRCFRCGTNHHKTLQCPNDPGNNSLKRTSSMGNIPSADIADPKRFAADVNDLVPLYDQYMDARVKYFYFRERLMKELKARTSVSSLTVPTPFVNGAYSAPPPTTLHYEYLFLFG
ncbi:unnamed protein product [Dracunculus medinensis]|uniref:RRM domain-containing protein n=1 Tax=Dracunculus medinensis TaxID=318479 RepID=A0A0N4UQ58_DRAME|nr:unnamed protein product [Dracunculus medinensis]